MEQNPYVYKWIGMAKNRSNPTSTNKQRQMEMAKSVSNPIFIYKPMGMEKTEEQIKTHTYMQTNVNGKE